MTLYGDTEPYKSIAATMARFTFTRPVGIGDCDIVRAELEAVAPGCSVRVALPWPDVVSVEVKDSAGLAVYTREFVAI